MNTKSRSLAHWLFAVLFIVFALPAATFAADAAAAAIAVSGAASETVSALAVSAPAPSQAALPWQLALIPVLTPIIIAAVKWLAPQIPGKLIPILAPVLGCALDIILHFSAGTAINPWLAMGLGLGGVGVREILDQLKKPAVETQ